VRKIVATEFYSLDGLMSDPKDEMEWVTANFPEALGEYEDGIYDSSDTLLLGRTTYQIFEGYWPKAAADREMAGENYEMAQKIDSIAKVVVSSTLEQVDWQPTTILSSLDRDKIEDLKRQPGKNILVVGSASIVQQLSDLKLIDEYHLALFPVVLGEGKPLFKDSNQSLKLASSRDVGNGVILLRYTPA
jgi:dihydrofolate reductase